MADEPMIGISQLIMGSAYCVQNQYNDGIASFRKCLEVRHNIPPNAEDAHVSAFSQYELGALLIKCPEVFLIFLASSLLCLIDVCFRQKRRENLCCNRWHVMASTTSNKSSTYVFILFLNKFRNPFRQYWSTESWDKKRLCFQSKVLIIYWQNL